MLAYELYCAIASVFGPGKVLRECKSDFSNVVFKTFEDTSIKKKKTAHLVTVLIILKIQIWSN